MRPYFAYGSNMWNAQMMERCPESRKTGRGFLADHRWIITARGYASVVASPGDIVEGVLFEISAEDEKALDEKEGVAKGNYFKAELRVIHKGGEVMALVYMDPVVEEGAPKDEYIRRINAGLVDANLSREYVERVVRRFVADSSSGVTKQ